jgi:hypothetical protein
MLSINEDFEPMNLKPKFKKIIQIDGPYIIGFDLGDSLLWIYNYERGKEYNLDDKMLRSESKDLTKDKVIFYPNIIER